MQRQDEFLRDLVCISEERPTQFVTLADLLLVIRQRIKQRLTDLKPVAMENADLSCGTTIDGEVVCSSRKGILAVQTARHHQGQVEQYWQPQLDRERKAHFAAVESHNETSRQWREQFDAMHQRAMRAEAKLAKLKETLDG